LVINLPETYLVSNSGSDVNLKVTEIGVSRTKGDSTSVENFLNVPEDAKTLYIILPENLITIHLNCFCFAGFTPSAYIDMSKCAN
jgi:hypothetical protein